MPTEKNTKFWKIPGNSDLELMRAVRQTQKFPRHIHEGFGVGVIEQGALGFHYRGENVVASTGLINVVNPDEPHTGQSMTEEGWSYRMFYFDAEFLREISSSMQERPGDVPFFQAGVIQDRTLAGELYQLHQSLEQELLSDSEQQSRLLLTFGHLIHRHADGKHKRPDIGDESIPMSRVRDYIEACYHENIDIKQLALIANLSEYHFIRVFQHYFGLTPHAWLTQIRLRRAKQLLLQGIPLIDIAYRTGFSDQSHLTRQFKRNLGITPGQYRDSIHRFNKR